MDYDTIVGKKIRMVKNGLNLYYTCKLYNLVVCATTSVGTVIGGPFEGKKMMGGSLVVNETGVILEGEFNEYAGSLSIIDME